jgi:4'-phosphopantetheinyl transferase
VREGPATRVVHVWFRFTEGLNEEDISRARAVLAPGERDRCNRFVLARDQDNFAVAHALLRQALTFHGDGRSPDSWVFVADSNGKPGLEAGQSDLAFNVSHTDGLVACGLASTESLGVDVESTERNTDADLIAERYFSREEVAELAAYAGLERHTRFIELWTLKEAFLKATGKGLRGISQLQFRPSDDTTHDEWHFALFAPSPDHRLAVAARSGQRIEYRVRAWPPELNAFPLVPLREVSVA